MAGAPVEKVGHSVMLPTGVCFHERRVGTILQSYGPSTGILPRDSHNELLLRFQNEDDEEEYSKSPIPEQGMPRSEYNNGTALRNGEQNTTAVVVASVDVTKLKEYSKGSSIKQEHRQDMEDTIDYGDAGIRTILQSTVAASPSIDDNNGVSVTNEYTIPPTQNIVIAARRMAVRSFVHIPTLWLLLLVSCSTGTSFHICSSKSIFVMRNDQRDQIAVEPLRMAGLFGEQGIISRDFAGNFTLREQVVSQR
jgi:hypothetical protein